MAIKIIKHGYKKLSATCPECNCEFTFLPTDMETYGNKIDSYESINCPDCGYCMTWWYGTKSGRNEHHVTSYN